MTRRLRRGKPPKRVQPEEREKVLESSGARDNVAGQLGTWSEGWGEGGGQDRDNPSKANRYSYTSCLPCSALSRLCPCQLYKQVGKFEEKNILYNENSLKKLKSVFEFNKGIREGLQTRTYTSLRCNTTLPRYFLSLCLFVLLSFWFSLSFCPFVLLSSCPFGVLAFCPFAFFSL